MALLPVIKNPSPVAITTTPVQIDSTGYYYHHITIYFTHTIQSGDSYTISYYKYNSVAGAWVLHDEDIVDYGSTGSNRKKAWEIVPTPGDGLRAEVVKTAGNNGTIDYEIIRAQ